MKKQQGLSLVEIIVGVAITGILAMLAVPVYREYIRDSETNKCALYIVGSRLNADSFISLNNGDLTGVDANTLGLTNTNDECSGGIDVNVAAGALTIVGRSGGTGSSSPTTRVFTMTRAAADGAWSCVTTDSSGNVIQTGSCTYVNN